MAVQKYIIDKDDIGKLIRGEEIAIMPRGNIRAFQIEVNDLKNVTNGDVIKALFPNTRIHQSGGYTGVSFQGGTLLEDRRSEWWNAPFNGGD